jgi:hypothetical protein
MSKSLLSTGISPEPMKTDFTDTTGASTPHSNRLFSTVSVKSLFTWRARRGWENPSYFTDTRERKNSGLCENGFSQGFAHYEIILPQPPFPFPLTKRTTSGSW